MKSIKYRKNVNPETAEALSIPETAHKWDQSTYMVKKIAKQCGAYIQVCGATRILQCEFSEYMRALAIKPECDNKIMDTGGN